MAFKIATELRSEILSGSLAPGTPLREEDLAVRYDVSRHVIREMLRMLVSDGVAQYSAFKGARVAAISVEDVRDIYRARQVLEGSPLLSPRIELDFRRIARIHGGFAAAVEKEDWSRAFELDLDFHHSIVQAAGCRHVQAWHLELFQSLGLAHLTCPEFRADGLSASVSEHAEIVVAIGAGELSRAHAMLMKHLVRAEGQLVAHFEQKTDRVPTGKRRPKVALAKE
jgi:DNA-binding GntR family transcriptional regulator